MSGANEALCDIYTHLRQDMNPIRRIRPLSDLETTVESSISSREGLYENENEADIETNAHQTRNRSPLRSVKKLRKSILRHNLPAKSKLI